MAWAELDGQGQTFTWQTSEYDRALVDEFKATVPPNARRWERGYRSFGSRGTKGHWEVSAPYWDSVVALCEKRGLTVIASGLTTLPESKQYRIELDYMGLVRHRGGDLYTSSGWVDSDWNATFTLAVLQEWFKFSINPGQMPTLFSVVGVDQNLVGVEFDRALKKAYRRAARTWHPDINKEPEAHETFQKINNAYELLQDPMYRKRYAAGLHFQKAVDSGSAVYGSNAINWRPPIRCGRLVIQATKTMGKYGIEKIFDWQDIKDGEGQTMVTYWRPGADFFSTRWVE